MAEHKNRKDSLPTVDLTWMPTQAKCVVCGRTLNLRGLFDFKPTIGGPYVRMDGVVPDEYEEWHLPFLSIVQACPGCVPPEGIVVSGYRCLPGEPCPKRAV